MSEQSEAVYRPRPVWPKVIGILSIVFGLLAVLFGVAAVALMPVWGGMLKSQLNGAPLPPTMRLSPLLIGVTAFGALVNLLLVVAGFVLIARKPAGRTLHLAYALLGVASTFVGVLFQLQNQAALRSWASNYPDNEFIQRMAGSSQGTSQIIGLVAGLALSLAWPVFCIIWFGMVKRDPDSMLGTDDEPI